LCARSLQADPFRQGLGLGFVIPVDRTSIIPNQQENFMTKLDLRTLRTVSGGGGYHGGGNHAPVLKPILSVKASVSVS
jgi:hypothetical protein